jgi:hypothetical protein
VLATPLFTVFAVLSLAVGVGVTTAMYMGLFIGLAGRAIVRAYLDTCATCKPRRHRPLLRDDGLALLM